jgi:hypothetical protein
VKPICRYLPFALALLVVSVPLARAQGSFDLALGFGTNHDKATGSGIDPTSFNSCTKATDSACQLTPSLGNLFMGFEGDAMLNKHIGFGGEVSFQPTHNNYGPLLLRETFYDFNGLYVPINKKKFQLRFEGGVGGAHSGFSYSQTACIGSAVCSTQSESVGTSNHFQVHVAAGVQIYVKGHFFVRPQLDFREVRHFTDQFGSDQVLGGSIWVGYNFGEM